MTNLYFQLSHTDIEKAEEAKFKAKFPNAGGRPISGHSAFLQKRLAKGVSFYFAQQAPLLYCLLIYFFVDQRSMPNYVYEVFMMWYNIQ